MNELKKSVVPSRHDIAGLECSEVFPCIAVEWNFLGLTPEGELIEVNYYPYYPHPLVAEKVIAMFGLLKPFVINPGEVRGVSKIFKRTSIILALEPENGSNLLNGIAHAAP